MSVRASSWAWESSRSTGASFLVLLALADHAGGDGGDCWPSVGRLARRCRVDERTVQRALASLVELGELGVDPGAGPAGTNRYRLTFVTTEELPLTPGDNPGETVDNPRQDATPGRMPPPASAPETPGRVPPKPKENRTTTPLPPASGGTDASHDGRHANCRACGTTRRGPKPPDPELAEAEARRARLAEGNAAVAAIAADPAVPDLDTRRQRAADLRAALAPTEHTGTDD